MTSSIKYLVQVRNSEKSKLTTIIKERQEEFDRLSTQQLSLVKIAQHQKYIIDDLNSK